MLVLAPIGSIIALMFAAYLVKSIMKESEGTEQMSKISLAVRKGAKAYLKRQYAGVGLFFAVMFVILLIMAFMGFLEIFVPFAFITGGFFSGLSGFIGMSVATRANSRTAHGCGQGLNKGLRIAFNSGAVMGLVVVGLGLLDISIWFYFLQWFYSRVPNLTDVETYQRITQAMLTFGMGASSMALFARVGGGIFTKAADVGADLVGKVEAGIPEDDPRNPAVIADNVGDNVGDVAGMGADLYESYVGSIISCSALAIASGYGLNGIIVPMSMASIGVLASILGTFLVRSGEHTSQSVLLAALRKGTYGSSFIIAIISFFLIRSVLGVENTGVYFAVLAGLLAGNLIGFTTEYFTSDHYKPTKALAGSSKTGSATIIISGLSLGMLSTALPVVIVGIAVIISFFVSGGRISSDFTDPAFTKGL